MWETIISYLRNILLLLFLGLLLSGWVTKDTFIPPSMMTIISLQQINISSCCYDGGVDGSDYSQSYNADDQSWW